MPKTLTTVSLIFVYMLGPDMCLMNDYRKNDPKSFIQSSLFYTVIVQVLKSNQIKNISPINNEDIICFLVGDLTFQPHKAK